MGTERWYELTCFLEPWLIFEGVRHGEIVGFNLMADPGIAIADQIPLEQKEGPEQIV